MRSTRIALLIGLAAALASGGTSLLSEGSALAADNVVRELMSRYDDLTKNHDDEANRERRYVLLDLFPYRTDKSVRKLLKDAFDEEKTVDNRTSVVHLLAGTGEPRDLDFLVGELKKERLRAPVIALGEGLSFTPPEAREEMTKSALKHLRRAKDDLQVSLLEGLGGLGHGDAFDKLLDADDLDPAAHFERNVALGRCGAQQAVEALREEATSGDPRIRLSAVLGLAATLTDDGWATVRQMLDDMDDRVVRAAAAELARFEQKDAAADIAAALATTMSVRTKEELRQALVTLLGRDLGYDAEAWKDLAAGKAAKPPAGLPEHPRLFGAPVASDAVVVLLDTSRSMQWMGRFERAKEGISRFVDELPDTTAFGLAEVSRGFGQLGEGGGLVYAAGNREAAHTWIDEQLTARRMDVKAALVNSMERYPTADTVCLVTDSHPWGSSREEQSRETLEVFRRLNRSRQLRVNTVLVMPGGRSESAERSESEIDERRQLLAELAEETGGTFTEVTE